MLSKSQKNNRTKKKTKFDRKKVGNVTKDYSWKDGELWSSEEGMVQPLQSLIVLWESLSSLDSTLLFCFSYRARKREACELINSRRTFRVHRELERTAWR